MKSVRFGALIALATVSAAAAASADHRATDPPSTVPAGPELILRASPARPVPTDPVIGAQDLLEIKVFQLDDLDQMLRVSDDGSISMPLLGRIEVAGLTREQVEGRIAGLLEERYINDPQVTVFVKEYRSRRVSVTGAVHKPGSFEMLGERTLLEMISEAGGVTRDVGREVVVIRRAEGSGPAGPDSGPDRIVVDRDALLYRGDAGSNITLRPGDIVYLPLEEIVKVYVNGAVNEPGALEIKKSETITVLQAVTAAGGTNERAAEKRAQIIRLLPDGTKQILPVNLRRIKMGKDEDVPLLRDDVVFVPEAFF